MWLLSAGSIGENQIGSHFWSWHNNPAYTRIQPLRDDRNHMEFDEIDFKD